MSSFRVGENTPLGGDITGVASGVLTGLEQGVEVRGERKWGPVLMTQHRPTYWDRIKSSLQRQ